MICEIAWSESTSVAIESEEMVFIVSQ
jgi:hypothetical protein